MSTVLSLLMWGLLALGGVVVLVAALVAALHGRNELAGRLNQALAERDRVRDTAARLEAELARREMETK